MTKGEKLLAVAAKEIGYHEGTGKRNKYGAFYKCDGMAWCMFFVQWCYEQAGMKLPRMTGSCGDLLRWYRANQPECVTDKPVPGCIVIFDFPGGAATDHTGLFVSRTDKTITSIDGNTSGTSQSNGGYVRQRLRNLDYARPIYIVPRELKEDAKERFADVGKTSEKEEQMEKRYNKLEEIQKELPWAAPTVEKMLDKGIMQGRDTGLDLSEDMLRLLVFTDRAGIYG